MTLYTRRGFLQNTKYFVGIGTLSFFNPSTFPYKKRIIDRPPNVRIYFVKCDF